MAMWPGWRSRSDTLAPEGCTGRAPLAVTEEGDDLLDEVAAPRRGQQQRSPLGDWI
jgi:hypothetical protein